MANTLVVAQGDLITDPEAVEKFGFPPETSKNLPQCDSIVNLTRTCEPHGDSSPLTLKSNALNRQQI